MDKQVYLKLHSSKWYVVFKVLAEHKVFYFWKRTLRLDLVCSKQGAKITPFTAALGTASVPWHALWFDTTLGHLTLMILHNSLLSSESSRHIVRLHGHEMFALYVLKTWRHIFSPMWLLLGGSDIMLSRASLYRLYDSLGIRQRVSVLALFPVAISISADVMSFCFGAAGL